jgi:hypothetical protein
MIGYPENHCFSNHSVKQFDDIYKEIESKYTKHEIKLLMPARKDKRRECSIVGG